ncbi:MAG: hypothetical protein L0332_04165 [Chloroflexi bacterium]|nr:hypothetical protein [Chloroflexota bacterium]
MKQRWLLWGLSLLAAVWLNGCLPDQVTGPEPCNEEGTLLNDNFDGSRNCGWTLYDRSGASAKIEEGVLRLSTSQPGQIWWANPGRSFDDVIITTQARQVSGPDDNAYGVICRYQSPENFYLFVVSGDGYYAIGKYQSGSEQIQYLSGDGQYQYSDVINRGVATNEIRASCIGNELSMSVNGIPLATITDPTFVTGDVGLGASTFQPGTTVIQFDNVRVIAP